MNFLSSKLFQKSYYLLKKRKIIKTFKLIFFIALVLLFIEIVLITYNYNTFDKLTAKKELTAMQFSQADKTKILLINQQVQEDIRAIDVLNKMAEIKPKNIEFSKVNLGITNNNIEMLIDVVADNANFFNDFIKILKENKTIVEDATLLHFSTTKTNSESNKKMGVIKIKLKKQAL